MCTKLMQIYQKRTPTFLAEITTLVATVILLAQTHSPACLIEQQMHKFYWCLLTTGTLQLLLKLVIFSILYWRNRQLANAFNTIVLFVLAGVHLGMWIYSVSLFGNDEMRLCHPRDRFFLKCYLFGYGAMIIGGVVVFVVLLLSAVGVTVSTLRRNKKEGEEEIEI